MLKEEKARRSKTQPFPWKKSWRLTFRQGRDGVDEPGRVLAHHVTPALQQLQHGPLRGHGGARAGRHRTAREGTAPAWDTALSLCAALSRGK